MRIAVADRRDPFLVRRRVVVEDGAGGWRDLDRILTEAGVAVGHAAAPGRGELPARLALLHGLDAATRRKIEAVLENGATPALAAPVLRAPLDADRKLILTAGREALSRSNEQGPAGMIVGFSKFPTALADPGSVIRLPGDGGRYDADAGLGVVLGAPAARVAAAEAASVVAGFTLMVDVTDRDISDEEQRTNNSLFARNRAGLSPLGPCVWMAGADRLDPETEITLTLNGEVRQRFAVADFAHGIADVVAAWSRAVLDPGDILGLGAAIARPRDGNLLDSPVAIAAGDTIEVACEPIGVLAATFAAPDG